MCAQNVDVCMCSGAWKSLFFGTQIGSLELKLELYRLSYLVLVWVSTVYAVPGKTSEPYSTSVYKPFSCVSFAISGVQTTLQFLGVPLAPSSKAVHIQNTAHEVMHACDAPVVDQPSECAVQTTLQGVKVVWMKGATHDSRILSLIIEAVAYVEEIGREASGGLPLQVRCSYSRQWVWVVHGGPSCHVASIESCWWPNYPGQGIRT